MSPSTTSSPLPQRSFGRYRLLHLIGRGGMGEVYLAKLTGAAGFEKLCVLKTILPEFTANKDFVDRFHHEAKILTALTHANIAQVYDMGEVDRTFYMALEYVSGLDLARILDRAREAGRPLPVPYALYIGQRIAEALGFAHRKCDAAGRPLQIVHRDVSPHNVLVSYDGEVKVIDFGLAKSEVRSKYTLPQTVLGKLGYMSPEQARGEDLDARTDIYSAGLVVYEMLAGRPVFRAGTMAEILGAMANPRVLPLLEVRPEVGETASGALQRAMAPAPGERYARAEEFSLALYEEVSRLRPVVGAELVGGFVRELCPTEFEEQRRLISGLSTLARSAPASSDASATAEAVAKTSLRPSSPDAAADDAEVPATFMRSSERPPVPRPRAGRVAVVGAGALVGIGAVGWLLRGTAPPPGPQAPAPPSAGVSAAAAAAQATPANSTTASGATAASPATSGMAPASAVPAQPTPPTSAIPVQVAATPSRAKPAQAAGAHGETAARKRKALEQRMEALRRDYDDLVAKVGAPSVDGLTRSSYEEVRSQFHASIGDAARYGELESMIQDAETYVAGARRRLIGQ